MSYKTQKFNIVLPIDLVKTVDEIAAKEYRNRSELIKEALRRYVQEVFRGRIIHAQTEEARLRGDFQKALEYIDQALIAYQKDKDIVGFTEALCSKVLTLQGLYTESKDKSYLTMAKHTAQSAVEIAEQSGNPQALSLPFENMAKVLEDLGELKEAITYYQKAVDNLTHNPYLLHDRPALVHRIKGKTLALKYKLGDKSVLPELEKESELIKESEDFHDRDKLAWLALSYLTIAEVLQQDNKKKAKEYYQKVKELIESDQRLDFMRDKIYQAGKLLNAV